jgi:hypothetical protein
MHIQEVASVEALLKMLTKIYFALWALYFVAGAVLFLTGNLTSIAIVVMGFIAFGMVFMGMMAVLPTAVHDSLVKH